MVLAMKVLLCILLGVLPAFAFPTPEAGVPAECIDPTFACQDLQSARLCRVVKTCIHDVWETMSVPDSNDEVCDICKEMVKEARDQLLSNMTQEEIKEVFEGSCKLLPVKIIANACIKVVDEIIPQLVEMLASRMDPTMVCTVSGMCFPTKKDMEIERHIIKYVRDYLLGQKSDKCTECTQMMTDVQTFMKSSTEAEVKTYVERLCHEKLPSYLCNIIVKTYFGDIYTFILNTNPAKMCSSVGVCPQKCEIENEVPKVGDELTCEFCDHLLRHVIDLMTANTTMDEFKTALLNFCKKTGKFSDKCTAIVNDYYDALFNFIKNLNTRGFCTLIGLCDNTTCTSPPLVKIVPGREAHRKIPLMRLQPAQQPSANFESQPLVKLVPAEMISKKQMKDSNDIFQLPLERLIPPLPVFQKDTECALCKAFSFYLQQDLAGDNSKVGVRNAMNGVCLKWMVEYPSHCNSLLNNYSLKMQMAIAKGISFDSLCSEVKACPLEENKRDELNVKVIPKLEGTPFCDLCKDAMNEVEKVLSDPATKQKLKDSLSQVCNVLPSSLRDDCVSFVEQNVDALIDILEQELQPDQICPALKLCGGQKIGVPQRVNDLECDVCKDMVTSFRTKLQDPASKEMVLTFLEEGCMRLPSSLAGECKKFVDDNIDYLMKIIIEEMDPQKVCSILKICPAAVHLEQSRETIKDVECELCKEAIGKLEDMLKDKKTEDEIKAALDKVCSYLPSSMSAKCQSFVDQYTDMIVTILMQELDPQMVCSQLGVCPAAVHLEQSKETNNDIECELCKQVIGKVEDIVKDQKTEDEIKAALDKVCSLLPSAITAKCESFVNQYTDILVTLLMEELDPQLVCAELKLCPATVLLEQSKETNDVECELCKEVVGKVEDMVKDQKTEEEIKAALDKVCSYLPSSMSTKCQSFVNQYTDMIVTLLIQELDPQMVCAELKLCTAQIKDDKPKKLKEIECDACKILISKVEEIIKDNKTEEEIRKALHEVCSHLPFISSKCEDLVNKYANLIVAFVSEGFSPDLVCATLKICKKESGFSEWKSKVGDVECEACQYGLHFIQNVLMSNDTQGKVKDYAKHLCSMFLPSTLSNNCEAFIDEYGNSLLVLVAQEIDPSTMCYKAGMCQTKTTLLQPVSEIAVPDLGYFQMDECSVCTTVVDYVDKLLEEDDVDKEITQLVEKVCTVLPASYQQKCSAMLETYGPYILQMIGQLANSKQLCQEIDLCARQPGQVHLIGGSKCTFGPSYWCHSPAHAAACKAESYCKSKVWLN